MSTGEASLVVERTSKSSWMSTICACVSMLLVLRLPQACMLSLSVDRYTGEMS